MSIDSNTFDISSYNNTSGIYIVNNLNFEFSEGIGGGSETSTNYVNITNNKLEGAYFPVMINDMGENYTTFYIYNNEFLNTGLFGITGRKISGIIKQNKFSDEAQNYCLFLNNSSADVVGNVFRSEKRNIVLSNSFPNLTPIRTESNQLKFKAGRNSLEITSSSDTSENISAKSSLPEIYLGENTFTTGNTYSYHIYGSIPSGGQRILRAVGNCWYGNNNYPRILLFQTSDTIPVGYSYIPTICNPSEEATTEITDMGFELMDTTVIVNYDSSGIMTDDEALFNSGRDLAGAGDYPGAIINYKAVIDNYDSSGLIYGSTDNLYDCYQALDTSSDEEVTDILYSDLKLYLNAKISSGNYDETFENNAYNFSLMCDTRLTNYNDALSGYEFIATYNPDAEQRLMASWEYQNIEDILEGEAGGKRDLELGISDMGFEYEKKIEKRIKVLDELVDKDPIKKHLKDKYLKTTNENIKSAMEGIVIRKNSNEEKLIERSRQNLYSSRNLTRQQKERRQFEDFKLLLNPDNAEVRKEIVSSIPDQYSLSQNYPNPFNPVTKINYSLPEDGKVKLIIYDLLGREIMKLVNNEFKSAGKYTLEFSGINLSSGVYFYRLEANEFVQTKRMVLIK